MTKGKFLMKVARDTVFGEGRRAYESSTDLIADTVEFENGFQRDFVGAFFSVTEALYALSDLTQWERDLRTWSNEHAIPRDAVSFDLELLVAELRGVYDFVERRGIIYAFSK